MGLFFLLRFSMGSQDVSSRGRLQVLYRIEGPALGRDVPWSTIEAATGIDEATFRRLKHQFEAVDDGTPHPD